LKMFGCVVAFFLVHFLTAATIIVNNSRNVLSLLNRIFN